MLFEAIRSFRFAAVVPVDQEAKKKKDWKWKGQQKYRNSEAPVYSFHCFLTADTQSAKFEIHVNNVI